MKNQLFFKLSVLSLIFTISILFSTNLYAQGWLDKIKKKAEEKAEKLQDKILNEAEDKVEERAENIVNEELTELRTSYDTATFGYAIAFIDNTDLYEEKQKGQKTKRLLVRLSDESGVTDQNSNDPLQAAKDFYDLGEIAYSSRSYKRAEQSFLKSEQEFKRLNKTSHPLYPKLINNLGLLYYTTKQIEEGRKLYSTSITVKSEGKK